MSTNAKLVLFLALLVAVAFIACSSPTAPAALPPTACIVTGPAPYGNWFVTCAKPKP